ncbi:MAG: hypothetical protein LBF51_04425 [Zoogloeaceae bacterium]|jgi:hypothetical protein|nr:hypothetical protein [Zoogloeaceae bacterium]
MPLDDGACRNASLVAKIAFPLLLLAAILICRPAFADQAMCLDEDTAESAATLLRAHGSYLDYCEPCGAKPEVIPVQDVIVGQDCDYEVYVNGESIDLAYVFVKEDGIWVNVAKELGLEVEGVSEFLISGSKGIP